MRAWWFAAGAAAGVYATAKARRAAEAVTVDGIHDRLTGWFAGARVLHEELRAGTQDKETELRQRLALVPDGGSNVRQLGRRNESNDSDDNNNDSDTEAETWKGDD